MRGNVRTEQVAVSVKTKVENINSVVVFDLIGLGGTAKRVETCLHFFSQALITILVLRRPRVNWIQNGPRVVQVSAAVAAEIAAEGFVVILR